MSRLSEGTAQVGKPEAQNKCTLTFVMNYDDGIKNEIRKKFSENEKGITRVIGENMLIIAEK